MFPVSSRQRAFIEKARAGNEDFTAAAYHVDEKNLIHAHGRTYALSARWAARTGDAIRRLIQAFPDRGVTCERSDRE